jgi:hypothetical protein
MKEYWESGGIASRLGRFTLRDRAPGTHWVGGWVGSRAFLDAVVKIKIPSPRRESNPRTLIVQPVARFRILLDLKIKIYKTITSAVVLYGCETWSLTLSEEHRLRRRFSPEREEVGGGCIMRSFVTCTVSPNIVRMIN